MSPTPSDELDPTLPGAQQRGPKAPKPVPASEEHATDDDSDEATLVKPSERAAPRAESPAAEEDEDGATLVKPPARTVVRGTTGAGGASRAPASRPPPSRPPQSQAPQSHAPTVPTGADSTRTLGGSVRPSATPREPQILGGRFEVVEVLGEGGMGKVYSVRDRQIEGRVVALKVLLPKFSRNEKFRSLFFQEIRAAQNFVNEHVVQVRDCGQMDDGRLFVTMDLVSGESLRDLMAREGSLRPRHALEIARQVLLALQSGHERGFVHRDVKPSNVMLTTRVPKTDENPYGVGARVLDFGIAGLAAELDEGNVAGTPLYMSPEQIQGQRLDARSDLFAVGIVLYEMLAGRRPFEGKTLQQITTSVIETDVAPQIAEMKELPAPIRKILEKALQKDRDKRFQSATDFIEAIESSSAYKLPSAVPGWVVGALVVAVLAAGVEGWLLRSQAQRIDTLQDERVAMQKRVDDSQDEITRRLNEQQSERTKELAKVVGDLNAANEVLAQERAKVAAKDTEIAELKAGKGTDYAALTAKIELQDERIANLDKRYNDAETARRELANAKRLADEANERLQGEASAYRQRAEKAEADRDALTAQLNPAARKARAFDDLLSLLERGAGAQARARYDEAVAERVFERSSRTGTDLAEELIEAELGIDRFESSRAQGGVLDISSLLEANRRLTQAKNLRQNFQVAANDWLGYETPDGTPQQRVQRLDGYVKVLSERIAPEITAISQHHVQDWTRIEGAGPTQSPRAALEHQKTFGCEHFAEFAASVSAHCEARLAPGGKLDTRALAEAGFLDEWGAHIEADKSARDASSANLLAFVYARRWHDSNASNDSGFDWSRAANPKVDGVVRDWRAVLRLQYEFSQPGSGYPIKPGRRVVHHVQDGSPLRWRVLEWASGGESEGAGPWEVRQTRFKADALPIGAPETLRIVLRRGMYMIDGASDPLLDLRAVGDDVWVAPAPQLTSQIPPPQLGVSQVALKDHVERMAASPGVCLVYRRGTVVRWFSPEFGLMLEELEGQPVRTELVFATPLR